MEKECDYCKTKFLSHPKKKRFCSNSCSGKFSKRENLKQWKLHRSGKFLDCVGCKSKLYRYPRDLRKNKTGFFYCWPCRKTKYKTLANVKEKISKSLMGRFRGQDSPNWKGGCENSHRAGYIPHKYFFLKKKALKRDSYTCQICKIYGKSPLHLDHIKPWFLYPQLRYKLSNVRILCEDCHKKTETFGKKVYLQIQYL